VRGAVLPGHQQARQLAKATFSPSQQYKCWGEPGEPMQEELGAESLNPQGGVRMPLS
jgi:hypothetical protein